MPEDRPPADELFHDNFLLEELNLLLEQIDVQIREVEIEAAQMNCEPREVRMPNGDWALRSLITAKAHTLNAMVTMKSMDNYARTLNVYNTYEKK